MKGRRGNPGLKGRLVDKSVDAYILALETINRVSIQYRVEAFCYLICNAWELLLKAKIVEDAGNPNSIYYKKPCGKSKRSLSLGDCLKRVMPNEREPMRRNIERIEELRDESTHLVIGHMPRDVMGLFQAAVINYHSRLNDWFSLSLSDRVPVGMMSIVYDLSPEQSDLSDSRLRRKLGTDAATFLAGYCAELKRELNQHQGSAQFSIGVDYHFVLTKNPKDADISLSSGTTSKEPRGIVEVAKDSGKTHPFRQKEVIEQVSAAIPDVCINSFDILCINEVHNIKSRREYFYQGSVKGSPGQYSQAFVDWIVNRCRQNSQFLNRTRAKQRRKRRTE